MRRIKINRILYKSINLIAISILISCSMFDLPLGVTINLDPIINKRIERKPHNAVYITDTTPEFDWDDIPGTTAYHFQLAKDTEFLNPIIDESKVPESFYTTPVALENKTTYWWRLAGRKSSGVWGMFTDPWSLTIELPVPTLILPAIDAILTDTTPDFKWDPVEEAVSYRLQLSEKSSFSSIDFDFLDILDSQFSLPSPLENTKSCWWRVAIKNSDAVYGEYSQIRKISIDLSKPQLSYPTDDALLTDTTPSFDWSDVTGAETYWIQISETDDFSSPLLDIKNIADSEYTLTIIDRLENKKEYYWRVALTNSDGIVGAFTEPWSFSINLSAPALISPIDDAIITDTTPELDWSDIPGSAFYWIQLASDSNITTKVVDYQEATKSPYIPIDSLPNKADYWWRVAMGNNDGVWSDFSDTRHFYLDFGDISGMKPDDNSTTTDPTPLLEWDAVPDAQSYELKMASTFESVSSASSVETSISYYQIATPIDNGDPLYWQVRAKNTDGSTYGSWSSIYRLEILAGLTITLVGHEDETITYEHDQDLVIHKSDIPQLTVRIVESFDSYEWFLDAEPILGQDEAEISIILAPITVGIHRLQCIVMSKGLGYSKELIIRIRP